MIKPRQLLGTVGCAVAMAAVLSGDAQNVGRDAPQFYARADLVTLPVTVTDQRDKYVADLDARQFQIFEDGRPQSVEFFQSTRAPLRLALMLDTSASMNLTRAVITEGTVSFIRALDPDDAVSVIAFSERVRTLQEFTTDHGAVERAIRGAGRGTSTSLHTALYVVLKELARVNIDQPTTPRRRVLILLSDGADTASLMPFERVLETAAGADTAIYAIRLETPVPSPDSSSDAAHYLLRQITEQTGGRAFFAMTSAEVLRAYKAILSELAHQYVLAYVSTEPTRSAGFRQLSVIIERPGLVARTRRGYFIPER